MNSAVINPKMHIKILILLCVGYFIDFYDLTVFSSSYPKLIPDLFNIFDVTKIQLLYLKIMNIYTVGILSGSIFFGILGDKFGRSNVIKLTILIYSLATLLSIFTHSLKLFMLLRFVSGAALAIEFATSSVLISEVFEAQKVPRYTAYLYFSGVLGGLTCILITALSWKLMFLFGGLVGIILYFSRKNLLESELFLKMNKKIKKGNIWLLINNFSNLKKLLRLILLIAPYNFLIAIMFIYPSFMHLNIDLSKSIKILLIGFFIGNLISTIFCYKLVDYFKSYNIYLLFNFILFIVILSIFMLVKGKLFIVYSVFLGVLGGGLPTIWIQVVISSFGTNQRSMAANILFAGGRCFNIFSNIVITYFISSSTVFNNFAVISALILGIVALTALKFTKEAYNFNANYIEK